MNGPLFRLWRGFGIDGLGIDGLVDSRRTSASVSQSSRRASQGRARAVARAFLPPLRARGKRPRRRPRPAALFTRGDWVGR